jgi:multimeric flavodoxin WrbA
MNIVAFNGSRRKQGNTSALIESALAPAQRAQATIETVCLGDYQIDACTGCEGCSHSWECVIRDEYADLIGKMDAADGVILASPTYWYTVTSDMKRFIDRGYSLIQYPRSRQQWIAKYEKTGKPCLTIAVCEQHEEAMMGNTSALLTDFAIDIGLEVTDSFKALGFFEAGSVRDDFVVLEEAEQVGEKLLAALQQPHP